MPRKGSVPIEVRHLFRPLDEKLVTLLTSLTHEEWKKPTLAGAWTVKDVASHLLDGNIRALSIQRDRYFGEKPPRTNTYRGLVDWLNRLNADWVKATARISPSVLVFLHKATGEQVSRYYESLDPFEEAVFPVSWAGESTSYNWMHLAREYTEKWHHQQQIREATDRQGIMDKMFFHPFIDTFFMALPHTFKDTRARTGTLIQVTVTSEPGGDWWLIKKPEAWELTARTAKLPDTVVELSPSLSWKLFSKGLRPDDVYGQVTITGNETLGRKVLEMVSVMA